MALRDRLAKLETKSRPLAISQWFLEACATKEAGVNFPACLRALCEWEVLLKPAPRVWKEVDAGTGAGADLESLSDAELLEMAKAIHTPENLAAQAVLLFEAFLMVPRDIRAPGAKSKLNECLRDLLQQIRQDAGEWELPQVERAFRETTAAMIKIGTPTEKDALAFIQSYQP